MACAAPDCIVAAADGPAKIANKTHESMDITEKHPHNSITEFPAR
jgi:hypothetical protein